MLTQIIKVFIALNSENSPRQIAYAMALGMVIGLTPLFSLHNLLILLLAFLIRVHLGSFFVSWSVFALLGLLFAPVFASLGDVLLTSAVLEPIWHALYQSTLFKLAHLHHTLTLGALVVTLVLFVPFVLLAQYLVVKYRDHVMAFVMKMKIVQMLKGSRFYQFYLKVQGGGA
ncbi:TIGR03546 family protein [Catenovulum agarivorans]|uniref:TIGR03546 family protein n=1 Tax=Catenovulum agarivorans TaxID=1172192 RepID=UPI0003176971|nr:TIGR03546 family protein [Catenovulum agarivorans]